MSDIEQIPSDPLYPEIATEIEAMVTADQDMRDRQRIEDDHWVEGLDKKNTERMKEIIKEIGWPTISKVGESGAHGAWLAVQQAVSLLFVLDAYRMKRLAQLQVHTTHV